MGRRWYRKPGYWMVALLIVLPLGYYGYNSFLEWKARKEAFDRLTAFGNGVIGHMKKGDFYDLQSLFAYDEHAKPAIEDIAMFISTAEIERATIEEWGEWNETDTMATLNGLLKTDKADTLPVRIMIVKNGDRLFLRWVEIKNRKLGKKNEGFPLDIDLGIESNQSSLEDNASVH